jgi:Mn2+/Fe2+ NRAMP family transporter
MDNSRIPTRPSFLFRYWKQILLFRSVFGPATITATADNDASGVATYAVAGAKLGYPILFLLLIVTVLLGITQEMGIRLTVVTRKGLADLIRERFGVKASMFIIDFFSLFMIVATTATLFIHGITLNFDEEASLAIQPFSG